MFMRISISEEECREAILAYIKSKNAIVPDYITTKDVAFSMPYNRQSEENEFEGAKIEWNPENPPAPPAEKAKKPK